MTETEAVSPELVDAIVSKIAATISEQPEGSILSMKEAFEIARETVREDVSARGVVLTVPQFNVYERSVYYASYHPSREEIAKQLVGLTLQDVLSTTQKAVERFLGKSELEIVPRPTLAFSGYCEPDDTWNLISNMIHARSAAEKAERQPGDEQLVLDMQKCEQMLHFLSQHDVEREDIDGTPYDGSIRKQDWLPRGATRPVASAPAFPVG